MLGRFFLIVCVSFFNPLFLFLIHQYYAYGENSFPKSVENFLCRAHIIGIKALYTSCYYGGCGCVELSFCCRLQSSFLYSCREVENNRCIYNSCRPFSIEFKVSIVVTFQSELSKLHPNPDPRTPRLWVSEFMHVDYYPLLNQLFLLSLFVFLYFRVSSIHLMCSLRWRHCHLNSFEPDKITMVMN